VEDISAAAARIATGDLSQRISIAETDSELGRLAEVLNSTFARLQTAFDQQARFTADAAHDLRTPVTVILTQTQSALARERPAEEYRETLEACQRAAQRMRRLIESLLELARLDAGQEPVRRASCDLAQIAGDCLELIRPLAEARGIRIHADLAAAPCQGDAERLAQVATNLLGNAIDYNHEGGEIRITTAEHRGTATLTVSNTGVGISADELPHVFERFRRADRARQGGHTGLGLAIAQAIVLIHGGRIGAVSEPGKGATFTVSIGG
jgi:signal transduction histidine kinase